MDDDLNRFKKYCKAAAGGCVVWTGPTTRGYANFKAGGKQHRAARWAWERVNGPIPIASDLHHVCWNRACVRPSHCRPMPHAEHMALHARRGAWAGSRNSNAKKNEMDVFVMRLLHRDFFLPPSIISRLMKIPSRSVYYALHDGWTHLQTPTKEQLERIWRLC